MSPKTSPLSFLKTHRSTGLSSKAGASPSEGYWTMNPLTASSMSNSHLMLFGWSIVQIGLQGVAGGRKASALVGRLRLLRVNHLKIWLDERA
jgi:hypothetical protein